MTQRYIFYRRIVLRITRIPEKTPAPSPPKKLSWLDTPISTWLDKPLFKKEK